MCSGTSRHPKANKANQAGYMEIKIYTTPTCQYCKIAKQYLEKHDITYEEYDVSRDIKARKEMIEKSHQLGVPVIETNGDIFVGFDRKEIGKALGIK